MSTALASEILRNGATAFASYAASDLLEREGADAARVAGGFQQWQDFFRRLIDDLATALRLESPDVFAARVRWQRAAFEARGVGPGTLRDAVSSLFSVVEENLPPNAQKASDPYLRLAIAMLEAESPASTSALQADNDLHRLALRYLDAIFSGDRRAAIALIEDAVAGGAPIADMYVDVLLPALVEVGRMWHLGEITVTEEHFVSDTTRNAMAILSHQAPTAPPTGRTVVTASVQGNAHDFGARVVADFFEMAGWRAICLGADIPSAELARAVSFFRADLLALSVTITQHLEAARRAIEELRRTAVDVRVLVGGHAFLDAPDVWRRLGADGYAATVREAPELGLSLVGGARADS